jgi:Universal stress protein family
MTIVLAALDSTITAGPVMEVAVAMGTLTGARVEAVHVGVEPAGPVTAPQPVAGHSDVPIQLLKGQAGPSLLAAAGTPEVIAVVIGARDSPHRHHYVGRTARHILENAVKPVVVVPHQTAPSGLIERLLVPLEGTEVSSRPVLEQLVPLLAAEVELVVLHVFNETTLPAMLDRPVRDLDILGREFLIRHCPNATRIEFRTGPIAARVAEVSEDVDTDLVVLSWSQNPSPERARVVREVLEHSMIPVLLLPDANAAGAESPQPP